MRGNVIISSVIQVNFIWSRFIRVAISQVNLILIYVLNLFNFNFFLVPSFFENIIANRFLNSPCIMTRRVPVDKIWYSLEGETPHTINIRDCGSDGSLWVHLSAVISILPEPPTSNISTTLQTIEGKLTITMYPLNCLIGVDNGLLNSQVVPTRSVTPEGVHDSYQGLFIPYSFYWQWKLFHPSAVGVSRLFRHQMLRGIPPNQSGQ